MHSELSLLDKCQPEAEFMNQVNVWLAAHGFQSNNTLSCVAHCRDELTMPLLDLIQQQWGIAFDMASLGGFVFAGRSGVNAGLSHIPNKHGQRNVVFFAFPHIGVTADDKVGWCRREGQSADTAACGALAALVAELQNGPLDETLYEDDLELSLMRRRLRPMLNGQSADIEALTHLAHRAILEDLERAIAQTVDTKELNYAVVTGIQVHGPQFKHYVWPLNSYVVVNGQRSERA